MAVGSENYPAWNAETVMADSDGANVKREFDLSEFLDFLLPGKNTLAIHGLNASASDDDFLLATSLESQTRSDTLPPLRVQALVQLDGSEITDVALHYRFMFDNERTLVMRDDGFGSDITAGDGIFAATIPAGFSQPGEMIRYYVTASTHDGLTFREPAFLDKTGENQSPQFFGTTVFDSSIDTALPVIHRFVDNLPAGETTRCTRASLFYDGEFYDNVFSRIREGSATGWPKKSYKVEFNNNHFFHMDLDLPRVDEIDLNTTYTDKSYVRSILIGT